MLLEEADRAEFLEESGTSSGSRGDKASGASSSKASGASSESGGVKASPGEQDSTSSGSGGVQASPGKVAAMPLTLVTVISKYSVL